MREIKLFGRLSIFVVVSFTSASFIFSQEAINLGGFSQTGQKELALKIAELRAAEEKARAEANEKANKATLTLATGSNGLGTQLPTSAQPEASGFTEQTQSSSEGKDARATIARYAEDYEALRRKIKESSKNYDNLPQNEKDVVNKDMQDAANRIKTLAELRLKYPDLVDSKYQIEADNLKHHLMDGAKTAFAGLTGKADESFIQTVTKAKDAQEVSPTTTSQSSSSTGTTSDASDSSSSNQGKTDATKGDKNLTVEKTADELVRAACSKNIGGRDGGPTLLKHLTSGECAKAIARHAEYTDAYGVKKIAGLLKEWQSYGRNSANLRIGIKKLADFGIIVYPSLSQAKVPDEVVKAVEIQQSQNAKAPSQTVSSDSPKPTTKSSEKPILNSSRATDN